MYCQNILKTNTFGILQRWGYMWKRNQVSCLSRRSINCDYTRMALIQRMNGSLQGNFQPHNPEWLFHSSFLIREKPGWRFLLWNASKTWWLWESRCGVSQTRPGTAFQQSCWWEGKKKTWRSVEYNRGQQGHTKFKWIQMIHFGFNHRYIFFPKNSFTFLFPNPRSCQQQ